MRLLHAGHDHDRALFVGNQSSPTDDEIKHALEGNVCRCTGYVNIVESISWAAEKMSESHVSR